MALWTAGRWPLVLALVAVGLLASPEVGLADAGSACDADYVPFVLDARAHRGDSQEARDRLLARLSVLDRRHRGQTTECAAKLWQQRAILETTSGRYDRVIGVVTEFLNSPVHRLLPDVTSRMYAIRGNARHALGATTEGTEDLLRSASFARQVGAPAAAASLSQAAESASLAGDWATADAYLREARAILLDSLPFRPDLELRLGRLGASEAGLLSRRLRLQTDPSRQQSLARRLLVTADTAVAILSRTASDDPVQSAYDKGDRALALSDAAYAAAVLGEAAGADRRLAQARALLTPDVLDLYLGVALDVWQNQWTAQALAGDTSAARQTAGRVQEEAAAMGDLHLEALALEALATFDEAQGQLDMAERRYVAAARLREIEWQRNRLHDWSATAFATAQAPYRGLARLYVRTGRTAEALTVLDGSRARALRDMRRELEHRERLTPALRASADSLLEAIQWIRVDRLHATPSPSERSAAAAELSTLQRRLRMLTRVEDRQDVPLDIAALHRVLGEQQRTLVSYLVGDHETIAFVVTGDTLVARTLPVGGADLSRWMESAGGPWRGDTDPSMRLAPLHQLYKALVQPLTADVPRGTSLVFVPDGPLSGLPFGLLVETPTEAYADAAFLIRRQPISVELAASLLLTPSATDEPGQDLIAFGRSKFDTAPTAWRGPNDGPLPNLPYVAREIRRVGDRIARARVALDADATEARLGDELDHARVVHIASHAHVDPLSPLHSRIFLWDDPDADDDGVLHLYELQARRLTADLIVLSGCSTADGQTQPGEGTLSLQYGVRAAGASAALATLWPVDDRAMAEVMSDFYTALAEGLPKDRALQQAQLAYLDRHNGLDASPFYWAALVLSGDVSPVALTRSSHRGTWLGVGALLALGLAWVAFRRHHARRLHTTL